MLIYALKRLAYVAVILAVMSVLIFWATQVMPGDVAQMIVGQFATDEQIRAVRASCGWTTRSTSSICAGRARCCRATWDSP
jgi:peptide/nickel transport system permease protein